MELGKLSSNWKRLQATLQSEKKPSRQPVTSKTARDRTPRNAFKRRTDQDHQNTASRKRRRMEEIQNPDAPSEQLSIAAVTSMPDDKSQINCGFVEGAVPGKYVALDCEMVGVGPEPDNDSQLARVSITDYNGDLLYDSYVRPVVAVTDYRSAVSGITAKHLREGYARPFKDVQADVLGLLEGRIVVGHALKNDFSALIIKQDPKNIRDTTSLPKYRALAAGRNPSLKKLAKEFLGLQIQGGEHSSIEDARTTMLLFRQERAEFEREHMRKWGKQNTTKQQLMMESEGGKVADPEKQRKADTRKKRLAKKKAKKR